MNTLTIIGTAAGTLIAVGTVLRVVLRRLGRLALWALAVSQLPGVVDTLSGTVGELSGTVADLSRSVASLQNSHPPLGPAPLPLESS
jgi:hypothetical protein